MPLDTVEVEEWISIRGVPVPRDVKFRQLIVTGPLCSGKSVLVARLGGWPEEGYLDLASPNWWRNRILTFRPREVHLGIPFVGHTVSRAVFDEELRKAPGAVDLDRVRIPPPKRGFFTLDWRTRFVFDFQLPPLEVVYELARARARRGTHPRDAGLTLAQIKFQIDAYETVALHLHRQGMRVYVRDRSERAPRRIVDRQTG